MSQVGSQAMAVPSALARAPGRRSARSGQLGAEAFICALGLGVLAVLMCAAHVRGGGLYYDDWSLIALGRFPGSGGLLHALALDYGQRPGQVLYYAAVDALFGSAASPRLALAAAALVLETTCLYVLLRSLSMRTRDAAAIAALTLAFPFSDTVWLWGVLSLTSLAICAALIGVVLALRALRSSGGRAVALHAGSLGLYVVSILSYEAFAVAGCLAGLLYARAVGLRRARARWAIDLLVILLALALARLALPIDVATPSRTQSLAGMAHHGVLILVRGARVIGAAALPVAGLSPWIGVVAIAAVLGAAAILRLLRPAGAGAELGPWLVVAGAGTLGALTAWAVYVPGTDHYAPTLAGTVNRMNAAAALGIATLVYSCIVLATRMLSRGRRLPAAAAPRLALAVSLVLTGGYIARSLADARAWDAAAADQRRLLGEIHTALPRLPRGSSLYLVGAPASVGPGVPVLGTTIDLTSAIRVSYSDPQLTGVPVRSFTSASCGPRGPLASGVAAGYGNAYLLDARSRIATQLLDRRRCVAVSASTPPA